MYNLRLSKEKESLSKRVYENSIVFDGLIPGDSLDYLDSAQKCINGGITVANVTVASEHNFNRAVNRIMHYKKIIENNPEKFFLVKNVSDIRKAKELKKLGVILGFQDCMPIEDNLDYLNVFYDMGIRIIQLTYNTQNYVGTGCCELSYGKITYFGCKVIKRMNELGIAIDLSHCNDPTTLGAIELSEKPVLMTHSSVYNICNAYGRNKKDDQIKELAKKKGVIGICIYSPLIKRDNKTFEVSQEVTLEDVIDHIEYVVNLVGINYVGFASDLTETWIEKKEIPPSSSIRIWRPLRPDVFGKGSIDHYEPSPNSLESHLEFINLARGLIGRGYKEEEVKKVLGENFIRVLSEVWKD